MAATTYVIKRDGSHEAVDIAQIYDRISELSEGLDVDPRHLAGKIAGSLRGLVHTSDLDAIAVSTADAWAGQRNPHYLILAARIAYSALKKDTPATFHQAMRELSEITDPHTGASTPAVDPRLCTIATLYPVVDQMVAEFEPVTEFSYISLFKLKKSYLLRNMYTRRIVERPLYCFMRVALGLYADPILADRELPADENAGLQRALRAFRGMAERKYIHASPTLFSVGTTNVRPSSCYLLALPDDSIGGIFDMAKDMALISSSGGGIGAPLSSIRANGRPIRGTNGTSNGVAPLTGVINAIARYVDQGGGKRKGGIALYMDPGHSDTMAVINCVKDGGPAKDLKCALWIPDLFMHRLSAGGMWSTFSPDVVPGLTRTYGAEYERMYIQAEAAGLAEECVPAREYFQKVVDLIGQEGNPYLLFKDACNAKSNQQHLGVISSSNLCAEIVEYAGPGETAVCNLASLCLPQFLKGDREGGETMTFNYAEFCSYVKTCVRNVDRTIDIASYPLESARRSNLRHRPLGIGVQGLHDLFQELRLPFGSPASRELNVSIFAHLYLAALQESIQLAKEHRDAVLHQKARRLEELQREIDSVKETIDGMDPPPVRTKEIQSFRYILDTLESLPRLEKEQKELAAYLEKERETMRAMTNEATAEGVRAIAARKEYPYPGAYPSFVGSPTWQGKLQYDLWDKEPLPELAEAFAAVKLEMALYGLRHSLLIAQMPTASTSFIMNNSEGVLPIPSNMHMINNKDGNFTFVNQRMYDVLKALGLWTMGVKQQLGEDEGRLENIVHVFDAVKPSAEPGEPWLREAFLECWATGTAVMPARVKELFRVVWDMKQVHIVDMAADRGPYICQSQSTNLHFPGRGGASVHSKLGLALNRAWRLGLKTGTYYVRSLSEKTDGAIRAEDMVMSSEPVAGDDGQEEVDGAEVRPARPAFSAAVNMHVVSTGEVCESCSG